MMRRVSLEQVPTAILVQRCRALGLCLAGVRSIRPSKAPRASVAHQRFLFTGEKTCIDYHRGIAHNLPDMRGIPGWQ